MKQTPHSHNAKVTEMVSKTDRISVGGETKRATLAVSSLSLLRCHILATLLGKKNTFPDTEIQISSDTALLILITHGRR